MPTRRQFLRKAGYGLVLAGSAGWFVTKARAAAGGIEPIGTPAPTAPSHGPSRAAAPGVRGHRRSGDLHATGAATRLWDGSSGVSGDWFNYGARLPWQNTGGDWTDANGVAQGPATYTTIVFPAVGQVSADITNLARRWYAQHNTGVFLRATKNAAYIATRTNADSALVPLVVLTLDDGTTVNCACIGSAVADRSSYLGHPGPQLAVQSSSNMCLQFALPSLGSRMIVNAVLKLAATQVFGALAVDVLELRPPKIFSGGTPALGLANNYAFDAGIGADPAVRLATRFSDANWNTRAGFYGYVAPDAVVAFDPVLGTPAINIKYHVGEFSPCQADHEFSTKPLEKQRPTDCPSEIYFRYYLKLKTGYQCSTDGKKLPGLAGRYGWWNPVGYYQPVDGNGGSPTLGKKLPYASSPDGYYYSGWSMRHHNWPAPTDGNPYAGLVVVDTYAYHAAMVGPFGDSWRWGNPLVGFVNLAPDQWYCIEQYVKVNTVTGPYDALGNGVGLPDGIIRGWVDGVLVFEKTDVAYRKHPAIKIDEVWLDHYHGGTVPAEAEHPFAMANVVVADSYIGPMKTASPSPSAWPFALPASGMRGPISFNVLNDVAAGADQATAGETVTQMQFNMRKVLGAWGSSAVSIIKDVSGNVVDVIYWIFGGGHGDLGYDGVCAWRASTGKFDVMLRPSKWNVSPTLDLEHGENIAGRPDSQHAYQNIHGLDSDEPNGPALVQLRGSAVGQTAALSGWAHRFDANTRQWTRFGSNPGVPHTTSAVTSAFIKDRSRKRFVRYPSDNYTLYDTIDYSQSNPQWQAPNQRAGRIGNWNDNYMPCGIHDPVRDLYLAGYWVTGTGLHAVPANDPSSPFVRLTEVGTVPTNVIGTGLQYRSATDQFILIDSATQPPTRIYVLTPPAANPLTNAWTWTTRNFAGPASAFSNASGGTWYNRWQYVAALDALIVCPAADAPMECWKL